ncbi:MAG TPA: sodium:solute symporter family protein [Clostridiales bacterium]|nr:sodium:solute symporter family protein [Clostridiales bacterium]
MANLISSIFLASANGIWQAYLVLFIYVIAMVAVVVVTQKKAHGLNAYLIGNRSVGAWFSAFGYGTTYFSAVVFVGYAGTFGANIGLSSIWIGILNGIVGSFFAWLILAEPTRRMTQRLNTNTMPGFFEKRYESKKLRLITAILIFILLIPYSTSVYQGIGYLCEAVFGIDFKWIIFIMAILTGLYLFVGGYFANALSNFIQGIIMLIGVIIMIALMLASKEVNGLEGFRKLTEMGYGFRPKVPDGVGWLDRPGVIIMFNVLLTSFGVWAVPQSIQKFYAIKDNSAIKKGMIISTIFALIVGTGAYLNGGFIRLFNPNISPAEVKNAVPNMFLNNPLFTYGVLGFICVLVVSASMSTLSSVSLVSASAIGVDIFQKYSGREDDDKVVAIVVKSLSFAFVMLSAILAILEVNGIVILMSLSWGTLAGCFMGPYIYGLYSKKATKSGVYISIFSCLITTIVLVFAFGKLDGGNSFVSLLQKGVKRAPVIGTIVMVQSMVLTPIGFLVKKEVPSKETLDLCFNNAERLFVSKKSKKNASKDIAKGADNTDKNESLKD